MVESDPRARLVELAGQFYRNGWMVGTAGNLSARLPDGSLWITASGRNKGQLTDADFIRVAADGQVIERLAPGDRPSAETTIHAAIYSMFPTAQACLHVHSVEANLVGRFTDGLSVPLPALEMIKGLGRWEPNPSVELLVLPNHHHVPDIAAQMQAVFATRPPQVPGFLIRDHGVTVWGPTLDAAMNHVELFDFLFRFMVEARRLGLDGREKTPPRG